MVPPTLTEKSQPNSLPSDMFCWPRSSSFDWQCIVKFLPLPNLFMILVCTLSESTMLHKQNTRTNTGVYPILPGGFILLLEITSGSNDSDFAISWAAGIALCLQSKLGELVLLWFHTPGNNWVWLLTKISVLSSNNIVYAFGKIKGLAALYSVLLLVYVFFYSWAAAAMFWLLDCSCWIPFDMDKSIAAVEDSQKPKILGSNVRITRKKGQNKFVAHLSSSLVFKYLMLWVPLEMLFLFPFWLHLHDGVCNGLIQHLISLLCSYS